MIRISWGWAPFIAVGMAAMANAGLIIAVTRVRPQAVTDRPYLESFDQDELAAARARFQAYGLRLLTSTGGDRLSVSLDPATALESVVVTCYRPADRSLDREIPWTTPSQPLAISLPADGRWQLRLRGALHGHPVQAETDIDWKTPE